MSQNSVPDEHEIDQSDEMSVKERLTALEKQNEKLKATLEQQQNDGISDITRRGALGVLGGGALLGMTGSASAQPGNGRGGGGGPPFYNWREDVDANEHSLSQLGTLSMASNSTGITDFAGENLSIGEKGVLNATGGSAPPSRSVTYLTDESWEYAFHDSQNPQGVYIPSEQTTFIVRRGPGPDPSATWYDHQAGSFGKMTRIGESNQNDDDNHDAPSLCIDDNGYIYVFYGAHSTPFQLAKSKNPYDTTEWDNLGTLTNIPVGTYPSPLVHNNNVYIFYRAGDNHGTDYPSHLYGTIARSTDGGSTFSDLGPIIDTTGHPGSTSDAYVSDFDMFPDGKIHFSWTVAYGSSHNDTRAGAFHAIYDPSTGEIIAPDGMRWEAPLTWSDVTASAIEAYSGDEVSLPKHAGKSDGTIYMTHLAYNSSDNVIERRFHEWDPDAESWSDEVIPGGITNSVYDTGYPRVTDSGEVAVHAITNDGSDVKLTSENYYARGGDYHRFVKQPDGSWDMQLITPNPDNSKGWNPVTTIRHSTDEFPSLFCEWSPPEDENGLRVMAYGAVGHNRGSVEFPAKNTGNSTIPTTGTGTRIYLNNDQTVSDGTDTVVELDTASYGEPNFNSANNAVTIPTDGMYYIHLQIRYFQLNQDGYARIFPTVNGETYSFGESPVKAESYSTVSVTNQQELSAGDSIVARVQTETGVDETLWGRYGANYLIVRRIG